MSNALGNTSFPTPLDGSKLLPMLLFAILLEKHTPNTKNSFKDEYDYIIVGSGSAGSVVTSRLSEMNCVSILLLEAGSRPSPLIQVPALTRAFFHSSIDWKYYTVPQKHAAASLNDRKVPFTLAKMIGGSGTWNDMLFLRGNRLDYDEWAAAGASGWGYVQVLPYFRKLEDNREKDFDDDYYHGKGGPIISERPRYNPEIKKAAFKAAKELGYPIVNSNGENQYGFFDFPGTLQSGRRSSTATGYLVPIDNKPNVDIVDNAHVEKVVIDENRAVTGVIVRHGSSTRYVRATKEVILSAGAIHTPQILILSGIGPREHLRQLNISVVADLPVGQNLQDHVGVIYPYVLSSSVPGFLPKLINPLNIGRYLFNGSGVLSSTSAVNTLAFLRSDKNSSSELRPEYQLYFVESAPVGATEQTNVKQEDYNSYYGPYFLNTQAWCLTTTTTTKSIGTVTLNLTNPKGPPLIDPNYYGDNEDLDNIVKGMKNCHEIFESKAFKDLGARPFQTTLPGCEQHMGNLDQLLRCQAKALIIGVGHPVGTAKMGSPNDPNTVVDSELRVKGIQKLRVVDASVMPTIPSGNTNVPTIMIGEKASDIIKRDIQCDRPLRNNKFIVPEL